MLANESPLGEFYRRIGLEYAEMLGRIDSPIVRTFRSAETTTSGIHLGKEGLRRPSSTWTYLIHDNPSATCCNGCFESSFGRRSRTLHPLPQINTVRCNSADVFANLRLRGSDTGMQDENAISQSK